MLLFLLAAFAADPCADVAPVYAGPPVHTPVDVVPREAPVEGMVPPLVAASFDAVFDDFVEHLAPVHLSVALAIPGVGAWSLEYHEGAPKALWWASVGKMFTAATVLQLADEGKLSLDDPLSAYVPDFPNADRITIRQLLSHTSGVYSFQADPRLRRQPRWHSPDELVAIGAKHGPTSCPGVFWAYSNTGYVLLGKVIEAVDGRPYEVAVRARTAPESALRLLPAAPAPADVVGPIGTDGTAPDPATPWAAGDVWGPAADVVHVLDDLLDGRIVSQARLAEQRATLYPMGEGGLYYGLGLMVFDVPASDKPADTWIGHAGGAPGVSAVVARSFRTGATVGVAMSTRGADDNYASALANALLALLPER